MVNNKSNTKRTKTYLVCAVLFCSGVISFWTLSERPLNNHECFVSITAREMLESGDWIMPTYNGEPRLQKTPLSYWLVAGLAKITGKVDEFTTRLPSAVFGILSVAAIIYFVNQWLSFRIAILSAAVWATSLGYIRYSHNARPEMVLTFFIMLCFLTFYSAVSTKSRKRQVAYMLVFWTSFGLANLAKGPAPLPLVLVPLFFYVAIYRQWKKLPKLLPVIGPIIFLAIVLPWPLAIGHRANWDLVIWKQHFLDRFFGEYARGNYPVYYYLLIMFKFITPWIAFLPMALTAPFYKVWNKQQPTMHFLWLWFIVGLAFLTISGGKRQHYILPLMPAMAILTGILIEDMAFVRKAYTQRFVHNTLRIHLIVIFAAIVVGSIYIAKTNPELLVDVIILGIVTLIIIAVAGILFAKRKAALGCGAIFVGLVGLFIIWYVSFVNPLEEDRYSKDFAKKIAKIVSQNDKLVAYEQVSPKTVQYFGRVIPEINDRAVLYEHHKRGDWILATGSRLDKLAQDGIFRKVYYVEIAERRKNKDAPGALFHKSAPKVEDES